MKLNVATELKLPGREGHAVLCERIEDIEYPGRWIRFADDVTVEINYVFDGSGFETSGSVKTALRANAPAVRRNLRFRLRMSLRSGLKKTRRKTATPIRSAEKSLT